MSSASSLKIPMADNLWSWSQITSNITATMDANQLPQFWFFISNNTALAAAMAPLGSNLTTSIDSYTCVPLLMSLKSLPYGFMPCIWLWVNV